MTALGIFKLIAGPFAILVIVGGIWWTGYSRGKDDTKNAIRRVIERKVDDARVDRDRIKVLPDKDIDCELLKLRGEKCD